MLRPLGPGERVDAAFKIWGRNFLPMAKAMLVIAIPAGILNALVLMSSSPTTTTTSSPFGGTSTVTTASDAATVFGAAALNLAISWIVTTLSTATLYGIVAQAYLGQRVDWRAALKRGFSRLLSALWISFLVGFALGLVIAVAVAVVVAVHATGSTGATVGLGVLFGTGALVLIIWIDVSARLSIPSLMLEDVRGTAAVRRSFRLVRGYWWSVFGTLVIMALISAVAGGMIGGIFGAGVVATGGGTGAALVLSFFERVVILVLFTPLAAALAVVITIDMRVRKEGYDIELLANGMQMPAGPNAVSFIRPMVGYQPGYPPGAYGPPQAPGYPPGAYGPPQAPGYPPGAYGPPQAPGYPPGAYGPPQAPGYPPGAYGPPQAPSYPPGAYGPPQAPGYPPQAPGYPPGAYGPPQAPGPPVHDGHPLTPPPPFQAPAPPIDGGTPPPPPPPPPPPA